MANERDARGQRLVVGRPHLAQHRQSRRRGERVSRQRARLVDGAARRQLGHDVTPATEGADREPAADHLAEAPEVGRDAGPARGPRRPEPEAGDDLVEDEEGTAGAAGVAQSLEKPGPRRHEVHVGGHRLDDHAGDPLVELGDHVVGNDLGVGHRSGGHARRAGQTEHGHATPPAGQQTVGVAVIAAVELDDAVTPGRAARQAHGAHGGLGPGRDEAHLLAAGDAPADRLGQQDLAGRRRAECRAAAPPQSSRRR